MSGNSCTLVSLWIPAAQHRPVPPLRLTRSASPLYDKSCRVRRESVVELTLSHCSDALNTDPRYIRTNVDRSPIEGSSYKWS
ncbi:hypothetical protein OBBRIDRAFT_650575 [Obba rivulosa]|uniref:Uncharacterized protein n=1 Tax=Obba rivulosa TaxID=1052685 RepID=A0A8E2AWT0_9APHY|nr:hypothetical protein OBBRIDRAFT_650575 [Obba rivulosa]